MASKAVADAVDAYLAANWTHCAIFTENAAQEAPADGSAFILVQYFSAGETTRPTLERLYLELQAFRIVINVPRGAGPALLRQYGAALVALFRDVDIGQIHCLVPSEVATGDDAGSGNYWRGALVVPYRFVTEG